MTVSDQEFEREITDARSARMDGNEGKARVCARRAVGFAIRKYDKDMNDSQKSLNALEIIKTFANRQDIPERVRSKAMKLTLRVSETFELPEGIDLISDAISIYEYLKEKNN